MLLLMYSQVLFLLSSEVMQNSSLATEGSGLRRLGQENYISTATPIIPYNIVIAEKRFHVVYFDHSQFN